MTDELVKRESWETQQYLRYRGKIGLVNNVMMVEINNRGKTTHMPRIRVRIDHAGNIEAGPSGHRQDCTEDSHELVLARDPCRCAALCFTVRSLSAE